MGDINNKLKIANEIGIKCVKHTIEWEGLDEIRIFSNILHKVAQLNMSGSVDGIIVQLPLPVTKKHEEIICNSIYHQKDVDGFHCNNLGKMMRGREDGFVSCTPLGVMNMLNDYGIEIEGKNVAVIGRSKHVGLPLVNLLINEGATVTSCNSKTKNIKDILKKQDVVISAVGKAKAWNKSYFNKNAVLIDIGINVDENNKLCGDIDFESVENHVSACSPVPGGVGIMTVLALMENVIKSSKKNNI